MRAVMAKPLHGASSATVLTHSRSMRALCLTSPRVLFYAHHPMSASIAAVLAELTAEAPFRGCFLYGSRGRPGATPRPDSDWDLWVFIDDVTTSLRPYFQKLGVVNIYTENP